MSEQKKSTSLKYMHIFFCTEIPRSVISPANFSPVVLQNTPSSNLHLKHLIHMVKRLLHSMPFPIGYLGKSGIAYIPKCSCFLQTFNIYYTCVLYHVCYPLFAEQYTYCVNNFCKGKLYVVAILLYLCHMAMKL
ncbi:hypothetical protein AB205_0137720 [Aquarana catesbeiana]|uniref:Uncharacterized protein n=1 Tax=Aquarana catesbeiana TaxID=8400 RepID=A0A2G9P9A3_AQUCT|nr:hypothetical protein AB205_0137720 [Aquarana catesbeiana]